VVEYFLFQTIFYSFVNTQGTRPTGDIGTQWILDLCNGIVKEGCIPEDWKSSVVLPIYRRKGDPMECGSFEELNCWNML